MGKKVDGFVLTTGITTLIYLYLRGAIRSRVLCILFAMMGCAILRRIWKKLRSMYDKNSIVQRKKRCKQSGSVLMSMACMEKAEATEKLSVLIHKAYETDAAIEILQQFPSSEIQLCDVFNLWKQHRNEERLILCTSGRAGADVRTIASSLNKPKLAIVDADILSQLFSEYPECIFSAPACTEVRKLRFRRMAGMIINRKNAPKCLVMFVSLMLFYILLGNPFYLGSALLLLLLAVQSLRRKNRPAKLF